MICERFTIGLISVNKFDQTVSLTTTGATLKGQSYTGIEIPNTYTNLFFNNLSVKTYCIEKEHYKPTFKLK